MALKDAKNHVGLILLIFIFMIQAVPAQAGWFSKSRGGGKSRLENKVDASIGWRGDRNISLATTNLQSGDYLQVGLSGGFEFTASYRPARYLHLGVIYTNYAQASDFDEPGGGSISRSQFGFTGYIATPWTRIQNYQNLFYRVKIGGALDATGLKVDVLSDTTRAMSLGRVREHRFYMSVESGLRCFGEEGTGMFFLRLSYARSIYGFSPSGSMRQYEFDSGGNNHLYLDFGITI